MESNGPRISVSDLANSLGDFKTEFDAAKLTAASPDFPWYPYDSLANFIWFDRLLTGEYRDFTSLAAGRPILDVGCADGATSFYLEKKGFPVEVVDHPIASFNKMQGLRKLKTALHSNIRIHSINLDAEFRVPEKRYGLVLLLGVLYHMRNPFFLLEALSTRCRYCLLSTRIARYAPDHERVLQDLSVAYLVATYEVNNDASNYFIFSKAGLEQLIHRTGWILREYMSVGNTEASDPVTPEGDERAFCLLESQYDTSKFQPSIKSRLSDLFRR